MRARARGDAPVILDGVFGCGFGDPNPSPASCILHSHDDEDDWATASVLLLWCCCFGVRDGNVQRKGFLNFLPSCSIRVFFSSFAVRFLIPSLVAVCFLFLPSGFDLISFRVFCFVFLKVVLGGKSAEAERYMEFTVITDPSPESVLMKVSETRHTLPLDTFHKLR